MTIVTRIKMEASALVGSSSAGSSDVEGEERS
jgi:hypothetical protein